MLDCKRCNSGKIKPSLPYGGITHIRFEGTERSAFISAKRRPQRHYSVDDSACKPYKTGLTKRSGFVRHIITDMLIFVNNF